MKKKQQNERRLGAKAEGAEVKAGEKPAPSEAMIKHLRMVLSQIEGRPVSREEILALRQRTLVEGKKTGDNAARSDERPP